MNAALLLLALSPGAEPPSWQVASAPGYQVSAPQTDAERWDAVRDRIGRRPVTVVVGPPPRDAATGERFPSGFMGFADGVYDGVLSGGRPALRVRGVPAPDPFTARPLASTRTTDATGAGGPSTSSPGGTGTAPIPTYVRGVVTPGATRRPCPT